MKSGVKTGTIVFNRRNHGTNNNYVLFIIKTNEMFPIEAADPNNLECLRILTSIRTFFFFLKSVQCLWYINSISTVIPAGRRSHPRIITPIMSSETCKQFSLRIIAERRMGFLDCWRVKSGHWIELFVFSSEGSKRKNILQNFINSVSMVGKYKAILCVED